MKSSSSSSVVSKRFGSMKFPLGICSRPLDSVEAAVDACGAQAFGTDICAEFSNCVTRLRAIHSDGTSAGAGKSSVSTALPD